MVWMWKKDDANKHPKNCDDSWVVTTEGPSGPKGTKSAGALIGLSAGAQGLW